ncbi:hypothetical protein KY337_04735 [Candidatus Woesearchaeota archaeon]|nr:hypothetical protein [Candidatus Woesearchaeota archaeon]
MKKNVMILFAIMMISVFIMSGCASNLPPEPGSPGAPTGKATQIYEGYAPPVDVYDNDLQIFFLSDYLLDLQFDLSNFDLGVKVNHEGGFVYKVGYYYTKAGWRKYEFDQSTYAGSNWIKDSASTTLSLNPLDLYDGENYIVAYSCKMYDNVWRCGYNYPGGTGNQWMLQSFIITRSELPPEPVEPSVLTTGKISLSPNNRYYLQGEIVDLYAHVYAPQNILGQVVAPSISLVTPSGATMDIPLEQSGTDNCELYTYDTESYYACHVSYGAQYTTSEFGRYTFKFVNSGSLENFEVDTSEFAVVGPEKFNVLILNDIDGFVFNNANGYYWEGGEYFYAGYTMDGLWADVNLNIGKISDWFVTDPSYVPVTVAGQTVYLREIVYDDGMNREWVWISGDTQLNIYSWNPAVMAPLDLTPVLEAYLAKYPAGLVDYTLADFPNMFTTTGVFDGQIVVGDDAPADEVLGATNIAAAIGLDIGLPVGTAVLASQVSNLNQNLILVGRPSAWTSQPNVLIDQFGYPDFFANEGGLGLYQNGDYWVLVVTGYGPEEVKVAARAISSAVKDALRCKEAVTTGTLDSISAICLAEEEVPVLLECIDKDAGIDYYIQGTTSGTAWGTTELVEGLDYCITEGEKAGLLAEYYCDEGYVRSVSFDCPNGCLNGICISSARFGSLLYEVPLDPGTDVLELDITNMLDTTIDLNNYGLIFTGNGVSITIDNIGYLLREDFGLVEGTLVLQPGESARISVPGTAAAPLFDAEKHCDSDMRVGLVVKGTADVVALGKVILQCYAAATCTDSDGGLVTDVKGQVDFVIGETAVTTIDTCVVADSYSGGGPSAWHSVDSCDASDCYIQEAYCRTDDYGHYIDADATLLYSCPSGCVDGACIEEACLDSDLGLDFYELGTITGPLLSGTESSDICVGDSVRELFCNADGMGEPTLYTCPNGCIGGVCRPDVTASFDEVALRANLVGGTVNFIILTGDGQAFTAYGDGTGDLMHVYEGTSNKFLAREGEYFVVSDPVTSETRLFEIRNIGIDGVDLQELSKMLVYDDLKPGAAGSLTGVLEVVEVDDVLGTVNLTVNGYMDRLYTAEGRVMNILGPNLFPFKEWSVFVQEPEGFTTEYHLTWFNGEVAVEILRIN